MNAVPEIPLSESAAVDDAAVQPFPRARKIYVTGSRPDIRVPMREIEQYATAVRGGQEANPVITVYDTSGPYTDPQAHIDLRLGLSALREPWVVERNDTEQLSDLSSRYGRARAADAGLAHLHFSHRRAPPADRAPGW